MQDISALIRNFQKSRAAMDALMKKTPDIIGVESVKIVKQNFIISAYDSGNGITPWPKRKDATNKAYDRGRQVNPKTGKLSKYRTGKNSTYKGSVYSSSKPLLRQTLALFNSITYRASSNLVFIGMNLNLVPYAAAHNQGLNHEPRRQYMPTPQDRSGNPKIMIAVKKKIDYETNKAMKAFAK